MTWRVAAAALVTMALAGCTPGPNLATRHAVGPSTTTVTTDPATMGPLTLTVWDQEVRDGQQRQITALNVAFQQRYPNIAVRRVARSFEDLRTAVQPGLTSARPPDVVQVNNGRQDMGTFVRAGLLRPLDTYAQVYRWRDRYPDPVLRCSRYPDAGAPLGQGQLYGLPQTGEMVGIFYNKDKLARLGLQPPHTWQQFDSALAAAKSAGELPLQFGDLDRSSDIFLFGFAQNRFTSPETIHALATGQNGVSWRTEANRSAARTLLDLVNRGQLTEGFAGMSGDLSWQAFARGEGVFHISGTWLMGELQAAMGDSAGFEPPPPTNGISTVTGGTGLPFAISSRSRHPDAAAAYLDFITSPEAMGVLARTGNLPAVQASRQQTTGSLQRDVFSAWSTVSDSHGLVPYLDYATPNSFDTVTGAVGRLLAKKSDPDEFLGVLEADLRSALGTR